MSGIQLKLRPKKFERHFFFLQVEYLYYLQQMLFETFSDTFNKSMKRLRLVDITIVIFEKPVARHGSDWIELTIYNVYFQMSRINNRLWPTLSS